MSGVMASMTPKMMPVRRASDQRGFCRAVPLPTAAANASVDMARASNAVEARFMWERFFAVGREHNGTPPMPDLRRGDMPMVSPTEKRSPTPRHQDAEYVDASAS